MKWDVRVAMEETMAFLKKLNIELLHDPSIPLLDTNPKELKVETHRYLCTLIIAALSTITKRWKQSNVH